MTENTRRPLNVIRKDWGVKTSYAARPYLVAMGRCNDIAGGYFNDTAASVVRYFLSNAATWRGETAKRIKAELKADLAAIGR